MKLLDLVSFLVTIAVSISISSSSSSSAPVSQQLFYGYGSYFITLGVGTPPQNVNMSLDTGSDISLLQCSPCTKRYTNSNNSNIFNPCESSTFSEVDCGDPLCKQLQPYFYNGCNNNTCLYNITYMGSSFTEGPFSTETLTLGSTKLENIALGCGHDNGGGSTGGLLGLGRGDLSFITQADDQFKRQFSYCLAFPFTGKNSSIAFGPSAVTEKAVYTPLVYTNTTPTYYYVNLTGISVDGTPVPDIHPSVFDLKPNGFDGGVIFDSGTTITQLINEAYVPLRKAFNGSIQTLNNGTMGSPLNYSRFGLCYNISSGKYGDVAVPIVELHFDQGANMTLRADNTMILAHDNGTIATCCFAFISSKWYTTIGNLQQRSIQIVYDVLDSQIGFVPDSC